MRRLSAVLMLAFASAACSKTGTCNCRSPDGSLQITGSSTESACTSGSFADEFTELFGETAGVQCTWSPEDFASSP